MYGGAIRGGKTYGALAILYVLCKVFPKSRWAIVRKDLPTLRRNTIPSFEKTKPKPFVGEINKSEWKVTCQNGSEILFFPESLESDPEYARWLGLEVNGFLFEQAEELAEATFHMAIQRAGSWTVEDGPQPLPWIIGTVNPTQRWPKKIFYAPWVKGTLKPPYYYLPATIEDNSYVTKAYKESLKNLPPKEYKRFVEGNWETTDDPDQLIKLEWILAAKDVEPQKGIRTIGVDVARFGDDQSCLCDCEGNRLYSIEYHDNLDTKRLSSIIQAKMLLNNVKPCNVKIDAVGIGAGVVDNLKGSGYKVTEVIGGAKPIRRKNKIETSCDGMLTKAPESLYTFFNLRSQLYWEAREELRCGMVCLDVEDHKLIEDLTAPHYKISSDRQIRVESKDDIKKRLGRSPDAGDAYVYARAKMRPGVTFGFV
jgi:hypothetical protein